ncbi:hypothetical protein BMS3Bbin04_00775 [bacterium BMS3Bbin04]|nr:hypothetical protein BMS3Bbin04_00775 [bacterium BMS3Bbin04]
MNSLLLTRFVDDRFVMIHNYNIIEGLGAEGIERTASTPDELADEIFNLFGIPVEISVEVFRKLGPLTDPWN